MTRRKRNRTMDAGAPLPENIETDKRMCVCLCIPDEPEYRQAFRGQLASLGQWFFWEKGGIGDTRAKYAAELWRKVLYEDLQMPCGCGSDDKQFRFTDNLELESSTDGGITWAPDPAADPRLTAPLMPPLPGEDGDLKRCEAANNATSHIKAKADDLIADSAAWGSISGLLAGLISLLIFLSIIGSGGVLTPIMLGLAGSLLGIGSAAFAAAMTEDVYERLNCAIFCAMDETGFVDAAGVLMIQAEIAANEEGIAEKFLHDTVGLMGSVGLTNMGRTDGVASTFECSECECVDLCANWEIANVGGAEASGTYLGTFGGYRRYESTLSSSNTQVLTIMVDDEVSCCSLIDFRVLTPEGEIYAYYRINCENPLEAGYIQPTWGLTACVHYLSAQRYTGAGGTPFIVEILFGECL